MGPGADLGSQLAGGAYTILHYTYFFGLEEFVQISKLIVKKISKVDGGTSPRSSCSTSAPGDMNKNWEKEKKLNSFVYY